MSAAAAVSEHEFKTRYQALLKLINGIGSEAHARVAAHIRAITDGKHMSIAFYHVSSIPIEEKYAEYDRIASALGFRRVAGDKAKFEKPDWSGLKGQLGNGAKTVEPEPEVQRLDPLEAKPVVLNQAPTPTPPPKTEPEIVQADDDTDDLAATLARHLEKRLKPVAAVDEGKVRLIVEEHFASKLHDRIKEVNNNGGFPVERVQKLIEDANAKLREEMVTRVVLVTPSGETKALKGAVHMEFPKLLKACSIRDNILLVGPTGSGKTTAAEMVAEALELPFHFNGAIDTEYKLKGFIDANSKLISPAFRKAYENGGVYLFDEVDASLPPAVLAFNAALSNGWCDFPDGKVKRHPDCVIIAAGNTWLGGATFDYVGRMKQDAAFADRFAMLHWPIDEKLELSIASNKEWCKFVQAARKNVVTHGLKVIISPRATLRGEKLLTAGLDRADVIAMCVRKGMTSEQWAQVMPQQ